MQIRCTIILFLLLFSLSRSTAQVWENDYWIQSQEDADQFMNRCKCDVIEGDLIISGSDLLHLDSLYILKEVKGSVVIDNNINLISCDGLNNITSIGQDLIIRSNHNLINIDQFNKLQKIGANFDISDNYVLLSIKGFENLQHVGETLSIRFNSSLVELGEFKSLQFCSEIDLSILYNLALIKGFNQLNSIDKIFIEYNESLTNIIGFRSLDSIRVSLNIWQNPYLQSIAGFEKLGTVVEADLSIHSNESLVDFNAFNRVQQLSGNCYFEISPELDNGQYFENLEIASGVLCTNLSNFLKLDSVAVLKISNTNFYQDTLRGFQHLKKVGNIEISNNSTLKHIDAFNQLEQTDTIEIAKNNQLISVAGFNAVKQINAHLLIDWNLNLEEFSSFNEVRSIAGQLNFYNNDSLKIIQGFQKLKQVGDIYISEHNKLSLIAGFENLQEVTNSISINYNYSLEEIPDFNQLIHLGKLNVSSNDKLIKVVGFNGIVEAVNISINGNKNLQKIDGFKQLKITGTFGIVNNPNLNTLTDFHLLEEINGNCWLSLPPLLVVENHFSNLKIIKGMLQTNYTYFHQLDSVGELKIWENFLDRDTLNGFTSLKKAGILSIKYNEHLKSIAAFENLESVHTIFIEHNAKLVSITGFDNLILIEEDFHLDNNPAIELLNSFNQLKEVKQNIYIERNTNLASIPSFKNLEGVDNLSITSNDQLLNIECFNQLISVNRVFIEDNLKLETIPSFSEMKKLSILSITSNPSLKKLPDFNQMSNIYGISIRRNPNLLEIDGFKNLSQNSSIDISFNNSLLRIKGFNQLNNISNLAIRNRNLRVLDAFAGLASIGRLYIRENIQLRSIDNFSNLSNINDDLFVRDNLQLKQCCLINCWLEQGVLDTLSTSIFIRNNGSNCFNLSTLKSACETTTCVDNKSAISDIRLVANPVSESLQFAFILNEDQLINYTIYSTNDQLVAQGAVNGIRGSNRKTINLPPSQKGHYFLVLHNEQSKEVAKFLKL